MKGLSARPNEVHKSYLQELIKQGFQYIIGSGSFSTIVRVCEDKVVRKASNDFDTNECNVMRELIKLYNRKDYSINVVKVYSSYQKYQLLEYIICSLSGKSFSIDLTEFVKNNRDNYSQRLFLASRDKYFTQLYDGISWLHTNNIFHRDIGTNNLVISGDMDSKTCIKIIDFNLSIAIPQFRTNLKIIESSVPFRYPGTIGTNVFKSLRVKDFEIYLNEKLNKDQYLTFKGYLSASDFWSAIVVCFILVNYEPPWESAPDTNKLQTYFRVHDYDESDENSSLIKMNIVIKNMFENLINEDNGEYFLKSLSLVEIEHSFVTLQNELKL